MVKAIVYAAVFISIIIEAICVVIVPGGRAEAAFFTKPADIGRIAVFLVVKALYKLIFPVVELALLKFVLKKQFFIY